MRGRLECGEQLQGRNARVSEEETGAVEEEHFRPVGTLFVLAVFVLTMILLWASVYVILLSRGVTV